MISQIIPELLNRTHLWVTLLSFVVITSCRHFTDNDKKEASVVSDEAHLIHQMNEVLNLTVIEDGHKPPVSTRVFSYTNIAAYQALSYGSDMYLGLDGQLNGLDRLPLPKETEEYDFKISMLEAFSVVAQGLVYRDQIIAQSKNQLLDSLKNHVDQDVFNRSVKFGLELGKAVLNWAGSDGFIKIQNLADYTVSKQPGHWRPTPPMYGSACEPHWYKVRSFVLDSAQQFNAPPHPVFSTDSTSDFYQMVLEVYDYSNALTEEQKEIAWFWNDLPSNSNVKGHDMKAMRQISPPGHWVNIIKITCKKQSLSLIESSEAYAFGSIAMADAFKSSWYTKYFYDLIRPVTYINENIDPSWSPLLETPMFPEYTSAHSNMSAATATVLTSIIGENVAFIDSSEFPFGYSIRSFASFYDAAWEVTWSRLYGGIHYMQGCQEGSQTGHFIGSYILENVQTRKEESFSVVPFERLEKGMHKESRFRTD